jgi:hypothetical protein
MMSFRVLAERNKQHQSKVVSIIERFKWIKDCKMYWHVNLCIQQYMPIQQ